jgi:hypothetical protein
VDGSGNLDVKKRLIEMADGSYVEADVLNVVEKIRDYDSNLGVKYCDPALASADDPPYKIVELCPDGIERVVFGVWSLDETVLDRLYAADNRRTNVLLDIHGNNLLAKKEQERRYTEKRLEDQDILIHYLRSPKGRYSFRRREDDALVVIDDQEGRRHKVNERR